MTYEVEQKFPIESISSVASKLELLGATRADAVTQVDTYFAHPARDFAKTDEAFRIRRVGENNFVTYKGPKIDAATKTRHEIEVPIASGTRGAADFEELVVALGFTKVADVKKQRTPWSLAWENHPVEICVDDVAGLGVFVELEVTAEENELDAGRAAIGSLAEAMGLTVSERQSYLELLLDG